MEELDELLWDPHVAQEESHSHMRDSVEGLGDINGQDVVLFVTLPKPALCQEYQGGCCIDRHGPELPVRGHPLASQDRCEPPHEGGHEHSHVLLPPHYGPLSVEVPCGRSLGHQPYDGLMPQF